MSLLQHRPHAKSLFRIVGGLTPIALAFVLWKFLVPFDSLGIGERTKNYGRAEKNLIATWNVPNRTSDPSLRSSTDYQKLPLAFEPNYGQTNEEVKFLSRGKGYGLFLTSQESVLVLSKATNKPSKELSSGASSFLKDRQKQFEQSVIRTKLVGANATAQTKGMEVLPGKVNYLIGNDRRAWRTDIPTYSRIKYDEVYPGINLVYYGNQNQLEYDFVIAPGGDPNRIQLAIEGVSKLQIDSQGDLVLHVQGGEIRHKKPSIYQEVDGVRKEIRGQYTIRAEHSIGFEIGTYDNDKSLIIDPVLVYSGYVGGAGTDFSNAITVDSSGSAYLTGFTNSLNFPTSNSFQPSNGGGFDALVAKLNPAGTAFIYSTYIGGSGDDWSFGIELNASNEAFIAGMSESANFPTTSDAFQTSFAGSGNCLDDSGAMRPCRDGFVAKLNASGSGLVYSTYLGGSSDEWCNAIALDASGSAYLTGQTNSLDFPTSNPLRSTYGGGRYDAFLTKVNPSGSALSYSTYLGGSDREYGFGVAVDSAGNAHVTGQTASTDFPTVNPIQATYAGGIFDAFLTKIDAAGSALLYSTYLGGVAQDIGVGIGLDSAGSTYISVQTSSGDMPITAGAFQTEFAGSGTEGSGDAYVAKVNTQGTNLVYATYLGGHGDDVSQYLTVDSIGQIYLTGYTESADFPTESPNQAAYGGGRLDAFVTKLNPTGTGLIYSTYLGGSGLDRGFDVALDTAGNVYATGVTDSSNFPGTTSPSGGGLDGFVIKISFTNDVPTPTPTPAATPPVPPSGCSSATAFGWPTDGGSNHLGQDYAQFNLGRRAHHHTGIDIGDGTERNVLAAAPGKVRAACPSGIDRGCIFGGEQFSTNSGNHGLQGVVILEHSLVDGRVVYSLYGHLSTVESFSPNQCIEAGRTLGRTGALDDKDLHFEIKNAPVLHNPIRLDKSCRDPVSNNLSNICWGYTFERPEFYGYHDPIEFLHVLERVNLPQSVQVIEKNASLRVGPGAFESSEYRILNEVSSGIYDVLSKSGGTFSPNCPEGWYQIRQKNYKYFDDLSPSRVGSSIPDAWICITFTKTK